MDALNLARIRTLAEGEGVGSTRNKTGAPTIKQAGDDARSNRSSLKLDADGTAHLSAWLKGIGSAISGGVQRTRQS